jgi:hypothetical protein
VRGSERPYPARVRRDLAAVGLGLLILATGCDGEERRPEPADAVRAAATAYVDSLRAERWAEACDRMTAGARAAVADGRRSCPGSLRAGGALPREVLDMVARQLAGAPVRISGRTAALGPVGDLPGPLRFKREAGRWLVAP